MMRSDSVCLSDMGWGERMCILITTESTEEEGERVMHINKIMCFRKLNHHSFLITFLGIHGLLAVQILYSH